MDKKYISPNGLRQVWNRINELFAKKSELPDITQLARKDELPDITGIQLDLEEHTENETIHVTAADKTRWDAASGGEPGRVVQEHIENTDIHVTAELKNEWNGKQNRIDDLAAIRSGAELGATAIQNHQSLDAYATKEYVLSTYSNIQSLSEKDVGDIING